MEGGGRGEGVAYIATHMARGFFSFFQNLNKLIDLYTFSN